MFYVQNNENGLNRSARLSTHLRDERANLVLDLHEAA